MVRLSAVFPFCASEGGQGGGDDVGGSGGSGDSRGSGDSGGSGDSCGRGHCDDGCVVKMVVEVVV